MPPAVELEGLGFSYDSLNGDEPISVLADIDLTFPFGELALICGSTGSGKSTLLKTICGLAPKFTGGNLSGSLRVCGGMPRAGLVGYVSQNPESSFVADRVSDEIVFAMEQLGFERAEMQRRLNDVATRFGLHDLLERELENLSSGLKQRVAIAAALAGGQRILLLDEPTSSLDSEAAAETISLLRELADSGLCVIVVEHRFERLLTVVDSITEMSDDGRVRSLTTEDAKGVLARFVEEVGAPKRVEVGDSLLKSDGLTVKYRDICAVSEADLELHAHEVVGLFGPNGSGKSSLLWALEGDLKSEAGTVWRDESTDIALVPCPASDLLFLTTVEAELTESDRFAGVEPGTTARLLLGFVGQLDLASHPRDLSAGQQLALSLAIQLAKGRRVWLLDEPTSGLDYGAKFELATVIRDLAESGHGILVASHDEAFLQSVCTRVVRMDAGRLT